ncbi:MAG: energy-coupling factor transporter ATPase [Firmicutes bacterium]|nr:energy-coupling factor transporter ATPase [Bacillota bacterium]
MSIVIENLSYVYSRKSPYEKHALSDISLFIKDGEFFGIIGHTGSGKSTLVNHLNALTRIQSGKITINGMDLTQKKLDFKKLRSTVGMVFQYPEYQLFDETVARDVSFGPRNLKLPEAEIAVRVREAIEMVGLNYEEIKNRSPFELSGGQKRRAAIAGVLAMRPEILVLDEPTTGLDPRGKKEILELILRIKARMCRTIVMISHNMDEIAALADRIAVLHEGKLACVKPPGELFSERELLEKLNIKMPLVTEIANRLADAGLAVNRGIVGEDELVEGIIGVRGQGSGIWFGSRLRENNIKRNR